MKDLRFSPWFIPKIIFGNKTQTRRIAEDLSFPYEERTLCGVMVDGLRCVYSMHITAYRQEPVGEITESDAAKEGFSSVRDFEKAFDEIYGEGVFLTNPIVWVIDFTTSYRGQACACGNAHINQAADEILAQGEE